MSESPDWQRNTVAMRFEVPPTPSPAEWEDIVLTWRARSHAAYDAYEAAVPRLRALRGVVGAVARLHAPEGSQAPSCAACGPDAVWPCVTVKLIGAELGIPLPEWTGLLGGRPEPLDAPIPPVPTHAGLPAAPRPHAFVDLHDTTE